MTGKFILCFMHLCVQWVGSCQGSVSAAGRGSMSPGMALPMHTAPWDSLLSFSIMVPFHVPAPCSCSAGGSHPSAPQPPLPPGYSPVVTSPFSLGLSPALKAQQHGTSQHSMWGIWAGRVLQGRETATSNSCPSFYLHAKDGKIIFSFAFE